jgi:RHS repeat-associated protein
MRAFSAGARETHVKGAHVSKKMPQFPGRPFAIVVGGMLCAGLVGGVVAPAWSAEDTTGAGQSPVVGGFGLGDGLEAMVDERDGAAQLQLSAGALQLTWDSRRAGFDRNGFGPGWGIGLAGIDTEGGLRVYPTSGGAFEVDASHPSGLLGFGTHDVTFRVASGMTEGGTYDYVLRELGGTTTYFSAAGDPVERVTATGQRTRWEWDDAVPHRLLAAVDADDVRTELEWSANGVVTVHVGANLGSGPQQWRVDVDEAATTVTDPVGSTTAVLHDANGLLRRVDAPTGASTELTWHHDDDRAARIDAIRTFDGTGAETSVRRWAIEGAASPSGWPAADPESGISATGYETVLTDDATRVVSSYNALSLLTERRTEISTASGSQVIQDTTYTYPEAAGSASADLPAQFNRPTSTSITHHDAAGQQRTVTEAFVFDELGRMTHAYDGTTYAYDPLNRPISQTTLEGNTIATEYWADGSRKSLQTTTIDGEIGTTGFYWSGDSLINDTHTTAGDTTGTASYLMGGTREARTTTDESGAVTTRYSTHDRHQNVSELTDATGAVTTRYGYTDYGVTTEFPAPGFEAAGCGLSRNPFQYAGEYTDCTGTQHLRARDYDPVTARFTRLDPTPLHNRFAYADANPITNIDPSGHIATSDLVNYLTIGITVAFAAFTIVSAIWTGGSSLGLGATAAVVRAAPGGALWSGFSLLGATGLGADVLGALTATTLVVNDHMSDFGGKSFLPADVRDGLTYLDYALAGAGLVGALATVPYLYKMALSNRRVPKVVDLVGNYAFDRRRETQNFINKWGGIEFKMIRTHDETQFDRLRDDVITALDDAMSGTGTNLPFAPWFDKFAATSKKAEQTISEVRDAVKTKINAANLSDVKKAEHLASVDEWLPSLGPDHYPEWDTYLETNDWEQLATTVTSADR